MNSESIELESLAYQQLPLNCDVKYYENFISKEDAWKMYHILIKDNKIQNERLILETPNGIIETDGFKIFFATQELIDRKSHPEHIHGKSFVWNGIFEELRSKVESVTGKVYELAMVLYYPDGNFFAEYHYDQQTSGVNTLLPSISLGEIRTFSFKENTTQKTFNIDLDHGSMILMGKGCQENYMHSLLKDSKYQNGRINITFREPNFQ